MPDVFNGLREMSWRGIVLPISSRKVEFAHEQVKHPILFQDGEIIETTGAKNTTFTYDIPMREGIFKGPYKNLYLRVLLGKLLPALRDRTPGELIDPAWGPWRCKPMNFTSSTNVLKRDGEDLTVTFEHAPEQDVTDEVVSELSSVQALDERSRFLDASMEAAFIEPDLPKPEPLFNPLDVITGLGSQLELAGDLVAAKLDDLAFRAEKAEKQLAVLANPQDAPLLRSLRRLRSSSARLQQRVINPAKIPITVAVPQNMTITAFIFGYNMTLLDFSRLNPAVRFYLRQGQRVKVYPSAGPL